MLELDFGHTVPDRLKGGIFGCVQRYTVRNIKYHKM